MGEGDISSLPQSPAANETIPQSLRDSSLYTREPGAAERRGKLGSAKAVADILSSAYGVKFSEYSAQDGLNGYYDPETRTIYINQMSDEPVLATISHELLHDLKVNDPGAFNVLRQWVKNDMDQTRFAQYKKELIAVYDAIGKDYSGMTNAELDEHVLEEAMADLCSEVMRDPNTITRIAQADRNLAQRIMDKLKEILETIQRAFSEYFGGETAEIRELVHNFEEIQNVYQSILENSAKRGSVSEGKSGEVKFSYGGKHAVGMNQGMLSKAKRMRRQGATKGEILWETGWFVGLDGKWRFEIDDSEMVFNYEEAFNRKVKKMVRRMRKAEPQYSEAEAYEYIMKYERPVFKLSELIKHPKLFSYYPDLANIRVSFDPNLTSTGAYSPGNDSIRIREDNPHPEGTLIHEIQHAIQCREGFTLGSDPDMWDGTEEEKYEKYFFTAGEIEAREVRERLGMDEWWRKRVMPLSNVPGAYFAEDAPANRRAQVGAAMSIETLPDGKRYVQADEQVIHSGDPDIQKHEIMSYVKRKVMNGQNVTITLDNGEVITITGRTAWKLADKDKYDDALYLVKGNAAGVIDEVIQVSRYDNHKPSFKEHSDNFASEGFDYRIAYFRDLDGQYYELTLSVGVNQDGKEAYNIGKIKKIPFPEKSVSGSKAKNGKISFDNSISQSDNNVNTSIRSEQQKDTSFDKPMSVSRKQRATEDTLDSDSGSVVEYSQQSLSESGEVNVGKDTEALGAGRTSGNNDSVWQQGDGSETAYRRMAGPTGDSRVSLERGRGLIVWGGRIQSYDLSSTREKKRAYGLLREISERRIGDKDAEGRTLPEDVRDYFSNTVLKNEKGELIPLFHATDGEFTIFEKGAFGFHVGSSEQAITRGGRFIKEVYVNLKNPLIIPEDRGIWPALVVADEALRQGVITRGDYNSISKMEGFYEKRYESPANASLRRLLKWKGYDGIVYPNKHEGEGFSAMAFDPEQIKYVSNQMPTKNPDLRFSVSRKQRGTEDTLDSGSGSVVEYNQDITDDIVTDSTQMHPEDSTQLDNVVMQKQVALRQQGKQYTGRQFAYTNDYFVIFDSRGIGEYDFVMAIWVDGNEDVIDVLRERMNDGKIDRGSGLVTSLFDGYWDRGRWNNRHYDSAQKTAAHGSDAGLSLRASGRNGRGRAFSARSDSARQAKIEYIFDDEQEDIKYSVSRKQRATEAMDKYKETGDVRDLPERTWARSFRRDTENRSRYLANQMQDLEYQLEYADEESRKSIEGAINTLRKKIEDAAKNAGIAIELNDVLDNATLNRNVDLAPVIGQLEDTDKGLKLKNGNYRFNDFYRNMERFFGKNFHLVKPLVDGFDSAKGDFARMQAERLAEAKQYIVKELGIKPGSKESKAVQWIGEKQRNPLTKEEIAEINRIVEAQTKEKGLSKKQASELKKSLRVDYNETMLRNEFGDEAAERILKAERWFRQQYEELIDEINRTQRLIYPNRPDKQIPKRQDYMRHFREMETGFRGIRNIFEVDNNIAPELVLVSDHTKPKEKWASIKQQREGNTTDEGAIEGFLDYLPQAAYAIHINPYIDKFRGLARDIAELKAETGDTSANGFVKWLNDYASHIAGKSDSLDRILIDRLGSNGRKLMKSLGWFNNRVKSNAVLGNIGSVSKQVMNIPNGIQLLHNPARIFQGVWDVVEGLSSEADVRDNYNKSDFLTERFLDKSYSQFEKNGLSKGAKWLLGAADEFGTRAIWNAAYREGVALSEAGEITETPERYADILTRRAVAGRGVGEVPLAYQSQIGKLAMPFQIEVSNHWNVQRDVLSGKAQSWGKKSTPLERASREAIGYFAVFALGAALEALTGSAGAFNPLDDILDGIMQGWEEEKEGDLFDKIIKMGKRSVQNVAGDFVGSRTFGWVLGEFLSSIDEDWAKNLFNDRIFQSQGVNVPAVQSATKAAKDFLDKDWVGGFAELGSSFALPFGGKQLDKTIRGVADFLHGGKYQNDIYKELSTGERGDKRYDIPKTFGNLAKSALFGPGSLSAGQEYWDNKKLAGYEQSAAAQANTQAMKKFAKEYNKAHPDGEVEALYKELRDFSVYPFSPVEMVQDFDRDNKKHTLRLLPAEQEKYQKEQNKRMQENYEAVFKTVAYRSADAEGKVELLEKARKEATDTVTDMIQNDYLYKDKKAYGRLLTEGEHIKRVYGDATSYSGWSERSKASCLLSYAAAAEKGGVMSQSAGEKLQAVLDQKQSWTALDEELYRLADEGLETQLMDNAFSVFSFENDKKKYRINAPAEALADVWVAMEARFRTKLNQTIATATYQNATLKEKQDMISKAKSTVRADIKDELKRKYGYSLDDDFAKLMRMK